MYDQTSPQNAVAAIRVSTTRQGTEGDSPEAQREQIERFAARRNIKVKKLFLFLESASKEQQPMQEAIDYCTDPAHHIQLLIVKSIDRFTRGGSYSYSKLKMQLDQSGVRLVDIYGIIGASKVNTLEHLGVSYKWSVYDPTKNSEILEAERASDEKRDIMSRMIGAEIRYVRLGYWVRRAPFGFINIKAETMHGKRSLLEAHPTESFWIIKMFELKCRGNIRDDEIVSEINKLGFRTRSRLLRSKHNHTRIIGSIGNERLTLKQFRACIRMPLYAGVNTESWLQGHPVRCKFDGLVSVAVFNQANRGKLAITEQNGEIIVKRIKTAWMGEKCTMNPTYPYKRVIMCSFCQHPLAGSASRGRNGKHYPAYHCYRTKPSLRVPIERFHAIVEVFVRTIGLAPQYTQALEEAVYAEWERRQQTLYREVAIERLQIKDLKAQARSIAERIKFCAPITIKYLEKDLIHIEAEIAARALHPGVKRTVIDTLAVKKYAAHFAQSPELLLLDQSDPEQKANYLGLLFNTAPTFEEIRLGALGAVAPPSLSPLFQPKFIQNEHATIQR